MEYFFIFFSVLFILVILVDAVPQFNTWQSRIRIGRWKADKQWADAIAHKAGSWLTRTPIIKLTDQDRLIAIDIIKGNYTRRAIQHWQEAALLLGLSDCYLLDKEPANRTVIDHYLKRKFTADGHWKIKPSYIDIGILAYAILRLPWVDSNKYKPAFDEVYALIQSHLGSDGTVAYRKHTPDYRFVDTIGFISPFLIKYGCCFGVREAIDLGCKQIVDYNQFGMLAGTMIPGHAYNSKKHVHAGLFGWGRGLGWYAIGLVDAWLELPADHEHKSTLNKSLEAFSRMAISYQNSDGSWNWHILNQHAQRDSSATATLAYLLCVVAKNIPDCREECTAASMKALGYLRQVTRRSGAVDLSQGDTKDIGVYSTTFTILPFAQGFTLRAIQAAK